MSRDALAALRAVGGKAAVCATLPDRTVSP
jgi:hypothetical protein